MLRSNYLKKLVKGLTSYLAMVVGQNAPTTARKPNLGSVWRRRAFAHMHVNGLSRFVRPKEHAVTANEKETRQP